MVVRNNHVNIQVDRDFFDKMFEPSRKKIEKQIGVKITQSKFSRMLFKSKVNLNPKLNFSINDDMQLRELGKQMGRKQRRKFGIKKINK